MIIGSSYLLSIDLVFSDESEAGKILLAPVVYNSGVEVCELPEHYLILPLLYNQLITMPCTGDNHFSSLVLST